MRDALVAPITAPAEEDRDVVMIDAPPLFEEVSSCPRFKSRFMISILTSSQRAEYFAQGALAMNWIVSSIFSLLFLTAIADDFSGHSHVEPRYERRGSGEHHHRPPGGWCPLLLLNCLFLTLRGGQDSPANCPFWALARQTPREPDIPRDVGIGNAASHPPLLDCL
jgi:hypothetical protein